MATFRALPTDAQGGGSIRGVPITVVTTRDDEGVRTAREVYAEADTFTVTEDGLRLLAANDDLLALYPSGSWLSVFVDDPTPAVGAPPAAMHHEATARAASARGLPPMAEPGVPEGVPGRRERTPDPAPPGFRTVRFAPKLAGGREPAPPDGEPRPRMLRVTFSPKVYRAARQDAPAEAPTSEQPPRFRPVAFRPKLYRGARPPAAEPDDAEPVDGDPAGA